MPSNNSYTRNPRGNIQNGKWAINNEETEDFEQEKLIQEWANQQGVSSKFDFQYISSKGTARNTLIKGSISLDQKIGDDSGGTFADFIAGCDGRDLFGGNDVDEIAIEPIEKIRGYLCALKLNKGDTEWVIKILRLSTKESTQLLQTSALDSEW